MSRFKLALPGVAALLLALPSAASAQLTWDNVCAVGGYCASFSADILEYDPTPSRGPVYMPWAGPTGIIDEGFTHLRFTIANLQGSGTPGMPNPGPWMFRYATFLGFQTTYAGYPGSRPWTWWNTTHPVAGQGIKMQEGDVLSDAEVLNRWEAVTGEGSYSADDMGVAIFGTDGYGLYGCDHPGSAPSFHYFVGCETQAQFDFYLPGEWSFTDNARVAWSGVGVAGCTTGVNCYTVPEPSSALLLLGGLAGMALVARRRERLSE